MNQNQKRLLMMGMNFCKHYEINHNKSKGTFSLKVYVDPWKFITFTLIPDKEDVVYVRFFEQSRSYFAPSPRVSELDKICGKSKRKPGQKHAVIDIAKTFDIIQKLETYASSEFKFSVYPIAPESIL